jgi:hypothetical protein
VPIDSRHCRLTGASMHVRSACSRAAHPCAVWPEDAQHPVRNQCRVHMSQRSRPGSHLDILLCSKLSHTQYCAHDTQTWVRIRLVRLANAQLRERGQFGRGGSLRQLVRCVFPGNHVYRGRYGLVRSSTPSPNAGLDSELRRNRFGPRTGRKSVDSR